MGGKFQMHKGSSEFGGFFLEKKIKSAKTKKNLKIMLYLYNKFWLDTSQTVKWRHS